MLVPVIVYVRPKLLHEIRIQALQEGYDLDAITDFAYDNYLSDVAYNEEELEELQADWDEDERKRVKEEVERLEKEWEAGKEKRAEMKAELEEEQKKFWEGLIAEMKEQAKTDKKSGNTCSIKKGNRAKAKGVRTENKRLLSDAEIENIFKPIS